MRAPLLLLLIGSLLGLSACSPVSTAQVPATTEPAQIATTLPEATPSPTLPPPGGGEYWVASALRATDGSPSLVFITRPLIDAVPEIIFEADPGVFLRSLRWSPDGQYLLFTDYGENFTHTFYLYDRISRQLQTFDLQAMIGTPGWIRQIAWSPDPQSGQLAFSLCASLMQECAHWLVNIFQGQATPLNIQDAPWFWEPGGKSMIFVGWNEITRLELAGMTTEKLTSPTQSVLFGEGAMLRVAGFFPNLGGFLTTQVSMDGAQSYLLISEDASQESLLFQTEQGWAGELCTQPLLSPDGKQIGLNFSLPEYTNASVIGGMDQLPLEAPTTPNGNLVLLWSPDSSVYVTRIAVTETGPFSLGFYDAQTGSLLRTYQPPAPFDLDMVADSSSVGMLQLSSYSYFDSVWIP